MEYFFIIKQIFNANIKEIIIIHYWSVLKISGKLWILVPYRKASWYYNGINDFAIYNSSILSSDKSLTVMVLGHFNTKILSVLDCKKELLSLVFRVNLKISVELKYFLALIVWLDNSIWS